MGRWADAADGVTPSNGKAKGCALGKLLDSIPDDERAELQAIIDDACDTIPINGGRWTYIRDVVKGGGGGSIDAQAIAKHCRGQDTCRTT